MLTVCNLFAWELDYPGSLCYPVVWFCEHGNKNYCHVKAATFLTCRMNVSCSEKTYSDVEVMLHSLLSSALDGERW
jgi:hypothetical protein